MAMSKVVASRLAGILLIVCCQSCFLPDVCAQNRTSPSQRHFPRACSYFNSGGDEERNAEDDPEERKLDASIMSFYRLWCTAGPGTPQQREEAADSVATQWKTLWYRETPFNTAFHETGSFTLLVLMGITHRVPRTMVSDSAFLHDWLEDCSERCFMLYGDDDPGAPQEWRRMMRLRREVQDHLGGKPAALQVLQMLKSAKLYPVNR
jgi:hypothetical protein